MSEPEAELTRLAAAVVKPIGNYISVWDALTDALAEAYRLGEDAGLEKACAAMHGLGADWADPVLRRALKGQG